MNAQDQDLMNALRWLATNGVVDKTEVATDLLDAGWASKVARTGRLEITPGGRRAYVRLRRDYYRELSNWLDTVDEQPDVDPSDQ